MLSRSKAAKAEATQDRAPRKLRRLQALNKRRSAAAASRQEAEKVERRRKAAAFIEIWKH